MASDPIIWNNDVKLLRKDITGILIRANPAIIHAKNKIAESLMRHTSLSYRICAKTIVSDRLKGPFLGTKKQAQTACL
jgi:hypothetical protein